MQLDNSALTMTWQQAGDVCLSVHRIVPMHSNCSCPGSHAAETSKTQSGCHHMPAPSMQALQHCSSLLPEPTAVLQRMLQTAQSRRPSYMLCCNLSLISAGRDSLESNQTQCSRAPSELMRRQLRMLTATLLDAVPTVHLLPPHTQHH